MTLVSIQPFGLSAAGGGPRILRALYDQALQPVLSVATSVAAPPASASGREVHVPLRPRVPGLDGTRFSAWAHALDLPLTPLATRRLAAAIRAAGGTAVHSVAHSPHFWPAYRAARACDVPFLLTVHDDMRYLLGGMPLGGPTLARLGRVWREADERFVISEAIGREYAARWGERPYAIVTDGLRDEEIASGPRASGAGLRVYFAGLFHTRYLANLRTLVAGLESTARDDAGQPVSLTLRCEDVPGLATAGVPVSVLPFASETQVKADLDSVDVVWLPLMFDDEARDMIRFSLSTKLVTYLGSGLPILYQGPAEGVAYELLAAHDAAVFATEPTEEAVAQALAEVRGRGDEVVRNALRLAGSDFRLNDQRATFWGAVERQLAARRAGAGRAARGSPRSPPA